MNRATTQGYVASHQHSRAASKSEDFTKRTVTGRVKRLTGLDYLCLFTGYVVIMTLVVLGVAILIKTVSDAVAPIFESIVKFFFENLATLCVVSVAVFVVACVVSFYVSEYRKDRM